MTIADKQKLTKHLAEKKNIIINVAKSNHFAEELHKELLLQLRQLDPQCEDVRLNGAEIDATPLHSELLTVPMFNNGRLIWVRHGENVLKKISQNKTVLSYFVRDLPQLPVGNVFLLHTEEDRLPKELEFLQKLALSLNEPNLTEHEIAGFLFDRVKQMGYESDLSAMQLIVEKCNANQRLALSTLDQVFAYCLDSKKIGVAEVNEVCFDMEGDLIFTISNYMAERNIAKALHTLEKHQLKEPMMMFGFWAKMFNEAYRYSLLQSAGLSSAQIQTAMNLNYRAAQTCVKVLQKYARNELDKIIARLLLLDSKIKENSAVEFQKNLMSIFLAQLRYS